MSNPRVLRHGAAARREIVRGVETLARAVGCTLGPGGRAVLFEDRFGTARATRDGATVAREVHLRDQHQQLGVSLVCDAAQQVAREAGDGTTTCVVLCAALLRRLDRLVTGGTEPMRLAQEVVAAGRVAESILLAHSQPADAAEWVARVASVACKADQQIVQAVCRAYYHVGHAGVILLQEGHGGVVETEVRTGFRIDRGFAAPALIPESGRIVLQDPAVLVTTRTIVDGEELLGCLRACAEAGRPLVVVCDAIAGAALATVLGNVRAGAIKAAVVRAPGFEDRQWNFLHDLATWCGATVQDHATSLSRELDPSMMGWCARLEQGRDHTVLHDPAGGNQRAVDDRIAALELLRDSTPSEYDRDKAVERIGRLRGRIVEIRAGAPTQIEAREIRDRVEDAIGAVRVAYREGVQPGGGTALWRAAAIMLGKLKTRGARALAAAMAEPRALLLRNAGVREIPPVPLAGFEWRADWRLGLDHTGTLQDMLRYPDPTAVVRSALRAACSTAATILTADTAVLLAEEAG